MMIIGTLILTDTNKQVYKNVLKQTTRLLIQAQITEKLTVILVMFLILTWNHCSTRHGIIDGQKTPDLYFRTKIRLTVSIRRKNDIRTKQIKERVLKRYELWRKYAA